MLRSSTYRALLFVVAFALSGAVDAQSTKFEVQSGSRFWIEGTSTVSGFTCEAGSVAGAANLQGERVTADVSVPAKSFDCGVSAMNRDFRQALKADAHPRIRFTLQRAEILDPPAGGTGWTEVRAHGTLELAGSRRAVTLLAEGRQLQGDRVQIRGHHALRMTHFGIDPPSGLLGLVRAHDQVVVHFDLIATPSTR